MGYGDRSIMPMAPSGFSPSPAEEAVAVQRYACIVIPVCDAPVMDALSSSGLSLMAAAAGGAPLLFRQLFDADTGTFTYLLADVASRQGVLIDPVFEQHDRDRSLIRELGIELVACLDSHAHADHVTGR